MGRGSVNGNFDESLGVSVEGFGGLADVPYASVDDGEEALAEEGGFAGEGAVVLGVFELVGEGGLVDLVGLLGVEDGEVGHGAVLHGADFEGVGVEAGHAACWVDGGEAVDVVPSVAVVADEFEVVLEAMLDVAGAGGAG